MFVYQLNTCLIVHMTKFEPGGAYDLSDNSHFNFDSILYILFCKTCVPKKTVYQNEPNGNRK